VGEVGRQIIDIILVEEEGKVVDGEVVVEGKRGSVVVGG